MHERKEEMAKRAAAFVGLPGGFGTFEEVRAPVHTDHHKDTAAQIGVHSLCGAEFVC